MEFHPFAFLAGPPLLRAAMNAGEVTGQHHAGRWIDVGTPQRLAELDRELGARRTEPRNAARRREN